MPDNPMTRSNKTEKLQNKIRDIISEYHNQVPFMDEAPEILLACKESGLKFITERTEDDLPVYKDDYPPVRKADDPVEKLYPLPPISIPPKIEEINV